MPTTPTIPAGNLYMNATLYTGDGTTSKTIANGVAGQTFQPDFVWIKSRSQGYRHSVFDVVRGFGQHLQPSFTDAENTVGTTAGTSFFLGATSTGFTVGVPTSGTYSGNLGTNDSGATFVGWNWQAGQGVTSSNTNGTITSTTSVNTTAGFSVVTFTAGSGASPSYITVGHGLGVSPNMVIVKRRDGTGAWYVYHTSLATPATQWLQLNTTNAVQTASPFWGASGMTSSTLGFSDSLLINSATYVAYCWAQVSGYSAFGGYTGAGNTGASTPNANGPFIYCGFRPKFVLIKRTSAAADWEIFDSSRGTYNANYPWLQPNTSTAEASSEAVDFLSNGFKIRSESGATMYPDGATFIYAAFAENPFKMARAR